MKKFPCSKCQSNETTDSVEVFAYNVWLLCEPCEKSFYEMVDNFFLQPERSKREDLSCYDFETLQMSYHLLHNDYCASEEWHDKYIEHICIRIKNSIEQHKMRCSEHCGNTVRTK